MTIMDDDDDDANTNKNDVAIILQSPFQFPIRQQ
jgi:hypothetical protein